MTDNKEATGGGRAERETCSECGGSGMVSASVNLLAAPPVGESPEPDERCECSGGHADWCPASGGVAALTYTQPDPELRD